MTDDTYRSIKEKILSLRETNPKHYIVMFRKRYPQYWDIIESYNKEYFNDDIISNAQKIYNYIFKITTIPLCPLSNKPLKFWDLKFQYRKYAIRGQLLPETRDKIFKTRAEKKKIDKNYSIPKIINFKEYDVNPIDFENLKEKYFKTIPGPRLTDKLNQLRFNPELSKQIYLQYDKLEPMTACVWLLEHNMEKMPENWEYDKWNRCCKEKMSSQERSEHNKKLKYENALIYSKEETVDKLKEYVKTIKDYHSFRPSMFKFDVSLVKSIEEYTKELGDVKFAEKAYYILYGKPENNNPDINIVFTTFEHGYELRSTCSFESGGEAELKEWLRSLDLDVKKFNDKMYEIDAYISDKKIGIEYDGVYWHCHFHKDRNYHLNKTNYFKNKNIKLFHVFDVEWINKKNLVKSIIASKLGIYKRKIFARKCIIKEVDKLTKEKFLNENHIQGNCVSKYNLGLFYEGELVSLMTFGSRQITKKKQFELLRFCNLQNTCVIGAASKLFACFIKNHPDISYIKTYADIRFYSDNGFYENLGFVKSNQSKPNYFYVNTNSGKNAELLSRVNFQKHKLKDKLEIFDPTLTEEQNMINNGYIKVYDCGNYVFECDRNIKKSD